MRCTLMFTRALPGTVAQTTCQRGWQPGSARGATWTTNPIVELDSLAMRTEFADGNARLCAAACESPATWRISIATNHRGDSCLQGPAQPPAILEWRYANSLSSSHAGPTASP
jgi:hypothetical protein